MPELLATVNGATLIPLLILWAALAVYVLKDDADA